LGVWRENDAVEDNFGRGDVGGRCADIVGVIDQVAPYGETGLMGFLFLGTDCADDSTVRYFAVSGHLAAIDEEDGIGAFGDASRPSSFANDLVQTSVV
jgi:hypothetical protein